MNGLPRTLGIPQVRTDRSAMLGEAHVKPLTEFVNDLRRAEGTEDVPYFDPLDGGIRARCLCLLEAPGPKAVGSGFISRDNPDQTAQNFFRISEEASLPRDQTVLWNIVPWHLGKGAHPSAADIRKGLCYLDQVMDLLPNLQVVVLLGRKAQEAYQTAEQRKLSDPIECSHPSPVSVNTHPGSRARILFALQEAAKRTALLARERA